jgi:hypothetical protein
VPCGRRRVESGGCAARPDRLEVASVDPLRHALSNALRHRAATEAVQHDLSAGPLCQPSDAASFAAMVERAERFQIRKCVDRPARARVAALMRRTSTASTPIVRPSRTPKVRPTFKCNAGTTMRAQLLILSGLITLGLLGLGTPSPRAQSAADPGAAVPPVRYESITAGTKSYRPVEPLPWPDVNRRVAPPGEAEQQKDGRLPGGRPEEPKPKGSGAK